jgi:hypothetical protein
MDCNAHQGCQMVYISNQKSQFGKILGNPRMENVGIFYYHLEYITAIGYILRSFDYFVVIWYVYPVLVNCVKKNLAALTRIRKLAAYKNGLWK